MGELARTATGYAFVLHGFACLVCFWRPSMTASGCSLYLESRVTFTLFNPLPELHAALQCALKTCN